MITIFSLLLSFFLSDTLFFKKYVSPSFHVGQKVNLESDSKYFYALQNSDTLFIITDIYEMFNNYTNDVSRENLNKIYNGYKLWFEEDYVDVLSECGPFFANIRNRKDSVYYMLDIQDKVYNMQCGRVIKKGSKFLGLTIGSKKKDCSYILYLDKIELNNINHIIIYNDQTLKYPIRHPRVPWAFHSIDFDYIYLEFKKNKLYRIIVSSYFCNIKFDALKEEYY